MENIAQQWLVPRNRLPKLPLEKETLKIYRGKKKGQVIEREKRVDALVWTTVEGIIGLIQKEGGKKIDVQTETSRNLRLSVEFIAMTVRQEKPDMPELMRRTRSDELDFLKWQDSRIGEVVMKYADKVVDHIQRMGYGMLVKARVDQMAEGNVKSVELLSEAIGKREGKASVDARMPVEWQDKMPYVMVDGKRIPLPGGKDG